MRASLVWLAVILAAAGGCGPSIVVSADTESVSATSGADSTTEGGTPPGLSTTTTVGDGSAGGTFGPADESGGADSSLFLIVPDGGPMCAPPGPGLIAHCSRCDLWQQDCPRGEKCMPWASDGVTWNHTRCSPVVRQPAAVGAPCSVEGSAVSGLDDCDLGAMCFHVDPATNEGTCVALCTGKWDDPTCPEGTSCLISNGGFLTVCLPSCNPLLADCVAGEVCTPVDADFWCVPHSSNPAGYGEACEFGSECTPDHTCAPGDASGCGLTNCCTAYCDLSDLDPNPACPDAASGQICTPWYASGDAPPGLENLGLCSFPS